MAQGFPRLGEKQAALSLVNFPGTVAKGTALSHVLAGTGLAIRQSWCLRGTGQGPSGLETRSHSATGRFGRDDPMRQEDARPHPLGAGKWCQTADSTPQNAREDLIWSDKSTHDGLKTRFPVLTIDASDHVASGGEGDMTSPTEFTRPTTLPAPSRWAKGR